MIPQVTLLRPGNGETRALRTWRSTLEAAVYASEGCRVELYHLQRNGEG